MELQLITERLALRPLSTNDVSLVIEMFTDARVMQYAGGTIPKKKIVGEIEIGYFLKRSAWGNGYATEAVERILRFAFEDSPLEKVVAVIEPENIGSRRILEKTGFSTTGIRRAYGEDLPGFQITREDWLSRQ